MIKHIVLFKIKSSLNKIEIAQTLKKKLDLLPSKINEIVDFEVGINFMDSTRAFDIALISSFKNEQDLEKYRVHEEHQKVVEYIKMVVENIVATDYKM